MRWGKILRMEMSIIMSVTVSFNVINGFNKYKLNIYLPKQRNRYINILTYYVVHVIMFFVVVASSILCLEK